MRIEYRFINPNPKIKPLYSASPKKKTWSFKPKPKRKPRGKEYADSWKNV